jgi:hypothetical protein
MGASALDIAVTVLLSPVILLLFLVTVVRHSLGLRR